MKLGPALTYTDMLKTDTGLETADFKSAMEDEQAWRTIVIRGHHLTQLDTIGNCQRQVFSLCVSQHMHSITVKI